MDASQPHPDLAQTLRVTASILRDAGVRFALGGSLAAWARGGPVSQNDLDFMVKPGDAESALEALADSGMRPERPPEEWLFKAWRDDILVDIIFKPAGLEMTDDVLDRSDVMPVLAIEMPVMTVEDVLATKLNALDAHALDYSQTLLIARSLREQIDWARLRELTRASAFAGPFFSLVLELGIMPADAIWWPTLSQPPGRSDPERPTARVRVHSIGA